MGFISNSFFNNYINSAKAGAPPLPKTIPPPIPVTAGPRKIYRQDLVINVDDTRNELDPPAPPSENQPQKLKKTWSPAVLEDKSIRKEIMKTAKKMTDSSGCSTPFVELRRRSIENHMDTTPATYRKYDITTSNKKTSTLPSNWRKDEKSEKSVRDKIAMFSNESDAVLLAITSSTPLAEKFQDKTKNKSTENLLSDNFVRSRANETIRSSLKKKAQSVENLDVDSICNRFSTYDSYEEKPGVKSTEYFIPTPSIASMAKSYSVENLSHSNNIEVSKNNEEKHSVHHIPPSYASLPRSKPPSVTRTTSFSGSTGGGGSSITSSYEDRRRTSISNLLEQRKKSMSKLRGLIIPERATLSEDENGPILIDLPEIRSKDVQTTKQLPPSYCITSKREPVIANPRHYTPAYQSIIAQSTTTTNTTMTTPASTLDSSYKSIFANSQQRTVVNSNSKLTTRSADTRAILKVQQQHQLPPLKPPRTSLILACRTSSDSQRSTSNNPDESTEEYDSDSMFSSKIVSPPSSPVATVAPGKFALTRTLSSETNTSIASSTTSTLTSGSSAGSQASCSSIGSTPTIDMSRKISKSSSNESYVNRKNILALAKCRSGKDESVPASNALGHRQHQQRRYDDEDSTDGYDEDEATRPKPKQRNLFINKIGQEAGTTSNVSTSATAPPTDDIPINYRLVSSADNLVDMVINVATYVEVVTSDDTDADSKISDTSPLRINAKFIDEERRASFKAPLEQENNRNEHTTRLIEPSVSLADNNNDLAKWVRNEVAKSKLNHESSRKEAASKPQLAKLSVSESIQKFNKSSSQELPKTPAVATITKSTNIEKLKAVPRSMDFRKTFENTSATIDKSPSLLVLTKSKAHHERFSSLDSLASSSSGISSSQTSSLQEQQQSPTLKTTTTTTTTSTGTTTMTSQITHLGSPSDFGSFSSIEGSNHSLITAADLQLIIEEADPPLKRPEAMAVVLSRDSPECSVGVTLAGGADYETKEITVHRVLANSPAHKDGRLQKGDRILAINGLSMRGLTHRESVTVLKTPRLEVLMVITRSESLRASDSSLSSKNKHSSLGSLTSLNERTNLSNNGSEERRKITYHKTSQSLDIDLDIMSNDGKIHFFLIFAQHQYWLVAGSIYEENKSTESTASSIGDDTVFSTTEQLKSQSSNNGKT